MQTIWNTSHTRHANKKAADRTENVVSEAENYLQKVAALRQSGRDLLRNLNEEEEEQEEEQGIRNQLSKK